MNDSSEISELRRENEHLRQQLRDAQRLTALGELLSTTTHEFNNVLMTVINYAKIGLRNSDPATREKSFRKILASGERAAQITNSVLGMARNRGNKFESIDLEAIVEETLILLDREMSKYRIAVEREYTDVPRVHANGNQIQQVLLNLLINARQAMLDGGTLRLQIHRDVESNMVDMTVRDNGTGIPQDQLRHIFDSFYTTKTGPDASGKGGTGLGLATCRDIVDAHHGRIRVESTVGRGTAFTIRLPIAPMTSPLEPLGPSQQAVPIDSTS